MTAPPPKKKETENEAVYMVQLKAVIFLQELMSWSLYVLRIIGCCFSRVFLAVFIVKPNSTSNAKFSSVSTLSLPRVPKIKTQDKRNTKFHFLKYFNINILENEI